ncbi:MAG: protease, partial [Dysgonomonas sp.]
MTKLRLIILSVLVAIFCSPNSKAQNGVGGTPPSFKYSNERLRFVQQPFTTPINFKIEDLKKEDAITNKTGMPLRFAQAIHADLDIDKNGKWSTLDDGQKIWQLPISSPGANGLIVSFSEMYIPEGAQLFIYTADKSQIVGAYTHNENRNGGVFDSPVLFQDEVILEYVASTISTEEPRIKLSDIGYVYNLKNTNSQDISCMVNINCPEGDNWQLQKNGVLQMSMRFSDGWYYCSASLVNNARNDATPYILTADHCIADGSDTITFETVKFQFFRERSGCTTVNYTTPTIQETMIGAELLVDLSIYGKSDGVLLKLRDSIPTDWNVYYNGWDASNIAATSGVSIHHPDGAVKTISTFTES